MKQVTVKDNQSLRDIALQHYGTMEALGEIVRLNTGTLINSKEALRALGVEHAQDAAFYIDAALEPGLIITVDDKSPMCRADIVKRLRTEQTKYEI